jgi:serine/threonine-protein kinase RsbW
MPDLLTLTLSNRFEEASDSVRQALEFLQSHGLPVRLVFKVRVALEEILTNIIKYGHDQSRTLDINLLVEIRDREVLVRCSDDGRTFNPLEAAPPDLTQPLADRPVGGVGLHLVRVLSEQVDYNRVQGRNILDMSFRE